MQSKNFLIVFNQDAGKGHYKNKKNQIINHLIQNKCGFKIITSDELLDEPDLTRYDAVVAVGGDGTVLKVITQLVNTDVKLGIIPCGTANLFAASLCIPFNIQKALNILINGISTRVDIGKAGNDYFALRVGLGFDAEVVNCTTRRWKKNLGYLAYFIQGVISSFKLSNKSYKITIDDKILEVNANSIIIANAGNMFKNFFTIAPLGSLSDGKLDVFIVLAKNLWEFSFVMLQILFGRHGINPNVIYGQAKKIRIQSLNKNTHIDGEPYYKNDLDISIIPKALCVVVP